MKKKSTLLLAVLSLTFLTNLAISQVTAVGSNLLRIGSGDTDDPNLGVQPKRYLEEIANARIFFENITLGVRYEMDDPSEVGPNFQGVRRRWIEYHKDKLLLQAGDNFALYGRGLAMNAFESRPLNYDSWLDGIKGEYEYKWNKSESDFQPSLGVRMIAGKLAFHDVADTNKPVQNISARAINSQIGFFGKKLLLGTSFVNAFTSVSELQGRAGNVNTAREVNQPELYLNFLTGPVEGFLSYTQMRSNIYLLRGADTSIGNTGNAWYGSLSYAGELLGLTFEYKNYSYFVRSPGADYQNYLSKLPISNPPEVYKEFTYTSLTRTTHSVNFDDELGFQIEADITAIPQNNITLYAAASSQHNSYILGKDTSGKTVYLTSGSTDVIPKFSSNNFYPFWEAFAEVEHDFGELNYVKVFAHRRSNVITTSSTSVDLQRSTTVGGKIQYGTFKSQSLLAIFEHQWMYDTQKPHTEYSIISGLSTPYTSYDLTNELLTLQYSFDPYITFGGILDYSTQNEASRHFWPQGFISFRIGGSHTVLVSYGAERGGLNCTGGICRVVPAFSGLRVTVTSQL